MDQLRRTSCRRDRTLPDWVTGEEGIQAGRQAAGILQVEQVPRIGEDERLDVRQPLEKQFLPLMKA